MTAARSPRAATPRLLFAEDDDPLRETLGRALAARGFAVAGESTAKAAAMRAAAEPFDYALVDLRLPDGSGLELVRQLIGLNPGARIVVLTGYGSIATAVEAIKLGATHYLAKPVTVDDVLAAFAHPASAAPATIGPKPMSVKRLEWEHIDRVLRQHNGNISATARALSMHRRTLQRKLAKRPVRT